MCSYYHFRLGLGNLDPPDMEFTDFLKADIYPGYRWSDHVNSFLELKGNSSYDLMTVKYEDLHRAPLETMVEVRANLRRMFVMAKPVPCTGGFRGPVAHT